MFWLMFSFDYEYITRRCLVILWGMSQVFVMTWKHITQRKRTSAKEELVFIVNYQTYFPCFHVSLWWHLRLCVCVFRHSHKHNKLSTTHDGNLMLPPHLPPEESMIWLHFGGLRSINLHINWGKTNSLETAITLSGFKVRKNIQF